LARLFSGIRKRFGPDEIVPVVPVSVSSGAWIDTKNRGGRSYGPAPRVNSGGAHFIGLWGQRGPRPGQKEKRAPQKNILTWDGEGKCIAPRAPGIARRGGWAGAGPNKMNGRIIFKFDKKIIKIPKLGLGGREGNLPELFSFSSKWTLFLMSYYNPLMLSPFLCKPRPRPLFFFGFP